MSNQSSTFVDLVNALASEFENDWELTSQQTRLAYFEMLGHKYNLSAEAIRGVWDNWLLRKSKGIGMFDWFHPPKDKKQ